MEIKATRYSREDDVHITETPNGWLILCQDGPMWLWVHSEKLWKPAFTFESTDVPELCFPKEEAMDLLKTIDHVQIQRSKQITEEN